MKRTPEEHRARRLVTERSGGLCETCLTERATDYSHRIRRSQRRLWCPSGATHQCGGCHRATDRGDATVIRKGWHLKPWQDPLTTPIYLARRGWVLLRADGSVESCAEPDRSVA